MPALSVEQWAQVRREYEESDKKVKDIIRDFSISEPTLHSRRNKEGWKPREMQNSGKRKRLLKRAREEDEVNQKKFVMDFKKAMAEVRDASLEALKDFKGRVNDGEVKIKDFKEMSVAVDAMAKACGMEPGVQKAEVTHNLKFGLDLQMLSTRPKMLTEDGEIEI